LASAKPAAAVSTSLFTVPAGQTYLVKSIMGNDPGPAGDTVSVWAQDVAGVAVNFVEGLVLAVGARFEWDGWVALNPGEQLFVYAVNGNTGFWISGTKLPGIA
jgi:hypothetical protein